MVLRALFLKAQKSFAATRPQTTIRSAWHAPVAHQARTGACHARKAPCSFKMLHDNMLGMDSPSKEKDLRQPEDCPHCMNVFPNHLAMWRHKQRCANNPDPSCRWCELRFEPHKFSAHERKCKKNPASLASASAAHPCEVRGAGLGAVGGTHVPPAATSPRVPAGNEVRAGSRLGVQRAPEASSGSSSTASRGGGLAEAFRGGLRGHDAFSISRPISPERLSPVRDSRPVSLRAPSISATKRVSEASPHEDVAMADTTAVIAFLGLLALLLGAFFATKPAPKQEAEQVKQRPPFNPLVHGSVEAYHAAHPRETEA